MTRAEHLQWAKDRALAYLGPKPSAKPSSQLLDAVAVDLDHHYCPSRTYNRSCPPGPPPDPNQAYTSFVSDMSKHDETRNHAAMGIGNAMFIQGMLNSPAKMREWIEGFN